MTDDSTPADNLRLDLRAYERLADLLPRVLAREKVGDVLEGIVSAVEQLVPCRAVLLYEALDGDDLAPVVARGFRRRPGLQSVAEREGAGAGRAHR